MRIVNRGIAGILLGVGAFALQGCETMPPSQVEVLPVQATVSNFSGKTIASINYQSCGAPADEWSPVAVGTIASGGTATFDLPAACVNLQAFYSDGKLAGSQSGVRREFPFSWVIR
jgi:hypothetical protein